MRRLFGLILALSILAPASPVTTSATPALPRLVVMLVVDQMRNDYIDDYGASWTHGLRRLVSEGARFRNAAYPYFNTVTCACLLYTSPSPRDMRRSRMPSSA